MRTKEQKAQYDQAYIREKCVRVSLLLNKEHDRDIIDHLMTIDESFNGYVKRLIRQDMEEQEAFERMADRTRECERELDGMQIQLVDGYRDEDAIKVCTEEDHRIYVGRHDWFEYRIDVDARKLLVCYDIRNNGLKLEP